MKRVYFSGLDSVVECVYIGETLSTNFSESEIFVNPETITYMAGKVVIISNPEYDLDKIETLRMNGNIIISRVSIGNLKPSPYILRLDMGIIWNGRTIDWPGDGDISESVDLDFISESSCVPLIRFPKILKVPHYKLSDSTGNLTYLGWALQQVGQNIKESVFSDLDLFKTGKINPAWSM